jgi:acyl-CoA synthetase (AMP-forming)/AMP-acid ligase II
VAYIVEHSGAEVVLVDADLRGMLDGLSARHRLVLGEESDQTLMRSGAEPLAWEPDEEATATINYTSGTTARPKGVELTHRNLWINAMLLGLHLGVSEQDVYLHTLPLFHVNGWGMPYILTGVGGLHVMLQQVDGRVILERVDRHGVTLLCGAPTVAARIIEAATAWDGPAPGAGRVRMVVAGAPPPPPLIGRLESRLGWEFIQIYGLTETSPLLTVNRCPTRGDAPGEERVGRLRRAGAPALGVNLRIDDQGEVLARGSVVLQGYWNQPEASLEAIRDGWFHTGDGGRIDAEGFLHITDRKKDIIISGGENIASLEVESVLSGHPAVAEVAVIGVPHEEWGETVKALVVLSPGIDATEMELIEHCRARLAHFKCPTSVEFRAELPRTATGKLQKFRLRAPYWASNG